jgi:adenylate cyclase
MSSDPSSRAFERAGLLRGLHSSEERAARLELLEQLAADGTSLEEVQRAVREDRLALLPVERVFTGEGRHTAAEAAERSGLDENFLIRDRLAIGLSCPEPAERVFSDDEIAAFTGVRMLLEAGLPEERMLDLARVVGQSTRRSAEAVLQIFGEQFLEAGDSERDLGLRYAALVNNLKPMIGPLLETPVRLHMREIVRSEVVGRAERTAGTLPGSRDIAVCFADLVGFTRYGETRSITEVGDLASQLEAAAARVAIPPVHLVKMIGDAAMLVSPDADALVGRALQLVAATTVQGLPALRIGVAYGPALSRYGDWYGRYVNLASRIASAAQPESVVATEEVRQQAPGYRWEEAPAGHFKGIAYEVPLFRADPDHALEQIDPP